MANNDLITSADAVFTLTVKTLFNAPITLENWSSNRAWEGQNLRLSDTRLSIDGKLNKGFVPAAYDMTLTFAPNSNTWDVFDALQTASRQARTVYELNGELHLKGLGKKYTFVSGCVLDMSAVPNGGEFLDERSVHIRWENVLPAGI